jgi:hypothetical protein
VTVVVMMVPASLCGRAGAAAGALDAVVGVHCWMVW